MAESNPPELTATQVVDDLKQINGIGPAVERRLQAAGIATYAQLASIKPKKLVGLLKGLVGFTEERITTQDWIGQSRQLAAEAEEIFPEDEEANSHHRLHYAVYTVELLLDKDNQVRRTRVMYVQTQQEVTWTGWDEDKLHSFFIDSAQLRTPAIRKAQAEEIPTQARVSEEAGIPKHKPGQPAPKLRGVLEITEAQLVSLEGEILGKVISSDHPFEVKLLLDLSGVEIPAGERFDYEAILYAKQVGSRERLTIGMKEGYIPPAKSALISIQSNPLSAGEYRMEALVSLGLYSYPKRPENRLLAFMEGLRTHIY